MGAAHNRVRKVVGDYAISVNWVPWVRRFSNRHAGWKVGVPSAVLQYLIRRICTRE